MFDSDLPLAVLQDTQVKHRPPYHQTCGNCHRRGSRPRIFHRRRIPSYHVQGLEAIDSPGYPTAIGVEGAVHDIVEHSFAGGIFDIFERRLAT